MRRVETDRPISREELRKLAKATFGDLVKAVIDLSKEVLLVGPELHADAEAELLQRGSSQADLWGINLYPDQAGDGFIEFDSMINVRPAQGNRSRSVEDQVIQKQITALVKKLVSD